MIAKDVMTTAVVTVSAQTSVEEVARLLLERRISAVPVVDAKGRMQGIVSEGDLIRRAESRTERHRSWWLDLLANRDGMAFDYLKSHGRTAGDVMTREVITVGERTPLAKIATLLERHRIKRVPVLRAGTFPSSCGDGCRASNERRRLTRTGRFAVFNVRHRTDGTGHCA